MTVAYSTRYKKYSPTVATTNFIVPFPIADDDDLEVRVGGTATTAYSVTSTYVDGFSNDAVVILTTATTLDVEIFGARNPRRENDYLPTSPDLADNLQYDADLLTIVQQEQQRDVQNAADAKASADAAAASASIAAAYDGPSFDTVADLLADTAMTYSDAYSVGDIIVVREGGYAYEIAASGASDHDITNSHASVPLKMYYRPSYEAHPQAIAAVGDLTTRPATDEKASLNLAKAIAVREGVPLNLRGFKYRCEGMLDLTGLTVLRGSGFEIYFPPGATYDLFKEADGTTDVSGDSTVIAVDVSGTRLRFEGNGSLVGCDLTKFAAADRANINPNLCCLGGKTAGAAGIGIDGYLYIQGFAYPVYVPDLSTTGTTRQFARFTGGWIRSRFNLTSIGYIGASTNGTDEWSVKWRTDRCGGFGSITYDGLRKSAIHFQDFFGYGLAESSGNSDAEASTVSIDSGTPTTVTLSAEHDYLAAGDVIVIENGFTRASDSTVRPLVAVVASVSTTTVTLETLTPVNRTASGLKWYYRPPQWRLDNCHLHGDHMYFEGLWDCVRINDNAGLNITNLKGGGTLMSGRQGALFNALGDNAVFNATIQNEFMDSAGVDFILNYGMIRTTATATDAGLTANIHVFHSTEDSYPVGLVQGIDPVVFFSTGRVSRFGSVVEQVNVQEHYTNCTIRRYFASTGVATETYRQRGWYREGNLWVTGGSHIGTPNKTVENLTNSGATTIFSVGSGDVDLVAGKVYLVTASPGTRTWVESGKFVVTNATTIAFESTGGTNITFSASGGNVQAQLVGTPSPADVTFALLPLM